MSTAHSQSLSTRRGSTSAPDPFGTRVHLQRPSTSTLTIVRVPSAGNNIQESPSTHKKLSRRPGAAPSTTLQSPGNGQPEHRLSFAFSSFGQPSSRSDSRSPQNSPTSSPRLRPSSPHRFSPGLVSKPRLSAEQLVDLARQAVNARPTSGSTPHSPVLSHRPHSPHLQPTSPIAHPASPTFTPLPDDIYLPFIHRVEEVTQLISTPPTAKLFSLLSQAFPNKSYQDDGRLSENNGPPGDPVHWTYSQLIQHLTTVDRDVCSDADWVFAARKCIMSHSELIWERIKAALGVPPELDVDDFEEEQYVTFALDDSAIIDSPVTERFPFRGDHTSPKVDVHQRLRDALESGSGAETPTPAGQTDDLGERAYSPHGEDCPIGAISPASSAHDDLGGSHLTIEPLLSTSAHSSHPPPLSLPSTLSNPASDGGLDDIAEGAEDDAEEEITDSYKQDNDLVDPMQIQGLRISTSTLSPSGSVISSPSVNHSIPLFSHGPSTQTGQAVNEPSPRSIGEKLLASRITGLSRGGSLAGPLRQRKRPASMSGLDPRDWDTPYNPVGERGPGNPLFPSNFARLALGPTLRANNPSLRSPIIPPASRYAPGMSLHKGAFTTTGILGRKPRSQSWALPNRNAESEYAITVASGSSACE